jgi:hypothetical protein
VFGGEMQSTWGEWTDLLFARSFEDEVAKMREFQVEYEPKLCGILGIVLGGDSSAKTDA